MVKMDRTGWILVVGLVVGLLVMVAVARYGLSLDCDDDVRKFSAVASAAAATGGFLAFVVLVIYTAETHRLRVATEEQLQSQHQVHQDQVKLSLFDKRLLVYLTLRRFLNTLSELGKTHDAVQLLQDTNQAQFLFKPDVEEFLKEVYKRAHHLQSFNEQEERAARLGAPPRPESGDIESEHSWLISEAPKLAHQMFESYLKPY